jgi:hypothetical protein
VPSLETLLRYYTFLARVILFFFFPYTTVVVAGLRGVWCGGGWRGAVCSYCFMRVFCTLSPTSVIENISTVDGSTSGRLHIVAETR